MKTVARPWYQGATTPGAAAGRVVTRVHLRDGGEPRVVVPAWAGLQCKCVRDPTIVRMWSRETDLGKGVVDNLLAVALRIRQPTHCQQSLRSSRRCCRHSIRRARELPRGLGGYHDHDLRGTLNIVRNAAEAMTSYPSWRTCPGMGRAERVIQRAHKLRPGAQTAKYNGRTNCQI
jgi:hypothetical protein